MVRNDRRWKEFHQRRGPGWALRTSVNTASLEAAAAVWKHLAAFNQSPLTPAKAGDYRLYTETVIHICCDGNRLINYLTVSQDTDAGVELLGITGTINVSAPVFTRIDP